MVPLGLNCFWSQSQMAANFKFWHFALSSVSCHRDWLQHDNAPMHKASSMTTWFCLDWHTQSPDFNTTQRLWNELEHRLWVQSKNLGKSLKPEEWRLLLQQINVHGFEVRCSNTHMIVMSIHFWPYIVKNKCDCAALR